MKVPPTPINHAKTLAPGANKATHRRTTPAANSLAPGDEDAATSSGHAPARDFASVLGDVARTRDDRQERESVEDRSETRESATQERAESGRETRRREQRSDDRMGGGFQHQQGGVREAGWQSEAVGARAILHIADLERIVATVRTQITAGGQREVTLELRRSVLDGLSVKLSADASGRITAEFIAATEKVRAQLEARTSELADLLRSRGINLAALRTTLGSDAQQSSSGRDRDRSTHEAFNASIEASHATRGASGSATAGTDNADGADSASADNDASTYRA